MMKKTIAISGIILGLFFSITVHAQELQTFDPLARNLIYVEGEAKITVPVDSFSISFDFDVERPSFEEARKESEAIAAKVEESLKGLSFKKIEVIKGWDLIKQNRISLTSKAKLLSNVLRIHISGFPEGKLHESVALAVDHSIAVSGALGLRSVEVDLSDELEQTKKGEVISKALQTLDVNAKSIASGLGKKVVSVKRAFISNEQNMPQTTEAYDGYAFKQARFSSPIVIQKSFKVAAQVPEAMEIHSQVSGTYEID